MAMNPAAKDPNAFASSNLSGGKADSAILGVPQNQPMPSGPQPTGNPQTPLAQANNQAFGPNYWNTVSAQGGSNGAIPDYAGQIAAHNAQMLQQMQATAQPAASTQTFYGVGPNNELQIGDQVVPMGDNPTMAAQLIQTHGQQGITQGTLKPGFQAVPAEDVQQYLSKINRSTWDATKEVGKQFAGGVAAGGLDTLGKAAQWAGVDNVGAGLIGAGQAADKFLGTDQPADTWNRGTVAKGFINNARAAGLAIPVAGVNLGLTAAGMPGAAAAFDIMAVAPVFGASDAQQTAERVQQAGGTPEQAQKAGWEQFFVSGGTQAALGAVGGKVMAGGGYTLVTKLKQAVTGGAMSAEQAAATITNPAMLKRFAANEGVNMAAQSAGMAGQAAGSAAVYNANTPDGAQKEDMGDAALGGAGAGLYMGAMMAPMGAYHQWGDSARRAQLGEQLNTPTHQVDLLKAVDMDRAAAAIQPEMGSLVGKDAAKQFTADTQARSTDAYSDNLIAAERAARNETPGFGGEAAPGTPPASDAARQADLEAAFPPLTSEQTVAQGDQAKADKVAAKAQREQHELNATNALIDMGVAQPSRKDVRAVADALESGVDVTDPAALPFREAILAKKYALAKKALADMKGTNDSILGQARTGDAGLGGPGGGEPPGGVGAGIPHAGEPTGGVRDSTGAPAPSVQPPVADGNARFRKAPVEPTPPVEPAPKVKAEIPDFSLEHTPGTPSAAWLAAHPVEGETQHTPTNNLGKREAEQTGQPALFEEPRKAGKLTAKPKGKELTAEQAWNRLKRSGEKPEFAQLTPEEQRVVEEQHAAGRVTQSHWDEAMKTAIRQKREEAVAAAKQSRKRVSEDQAKEEAKPAEQRAAEEDARKAENLPPADIWKAAFTDAKGNTKPGEVIGHLMAGKTAEETAKLTGVSKATVEKALKRYGSLDAFDIAEQDGKLKGFDPEDVAAARRALEKAHEGAVVRKTAAEGGAHVDDMDSAEKTDLVSQDGTQIRSSEEATGFSDKEQKLLDQMDKLQKGIKQAKAEGDDATVAKLKADLDVASKKFASEQLKYSVKETKREAPEKDGEDSQAKLGDETDDLKDDDTGRDDESGKEAGNSDDYSYGKNPDGTVKDGYTSAEELTKELTGWMGVDKLPRHIRVVHDASELTDLAELGAAHSEGSPFGWTKDGKAVLIANRIKRGTGKGAFLHEVGSHLGLDNILGSKNIDRLHEAIKEWAAKGDGSKESEIAKAALDRMKSAGTEDRQRASEAVAYFIQEATDRGVSPTAVDGYSGKFANFVRMIYAAFKGAIRRVLRGGDLTKMSAEDMVNMAYGAARMEMAGTFHGTAAEFRQFNHKHMGSGEGAQAYGWGTYLAERYGIARGYHEADVTRKAAGNAAALHDEYLKKNSMAVALYRKAVKYELAGEGAKVVAGMRDRARALEDQSRKAYEAYMAGGRPDGTLFRTDHTVAAHEMLDWDNAEQTPHVKVALEKLWSKVEPDLAESILENLNVDDIHEATGKELIRKVFPKLRNEDSRIFDKVDSEGDMPTHEAVSKLLDSYGIKGSKHLDARSRDSAKEVVVGGKAYSRDELVRIKREELDHPLSSHIPLLRDILRNGLDHVRADLEDAVETHKADGERIYRESSARYDLPADDAKAAEHGEYFASQTYHGQQLKWLNENASKIKVQSQPVTHNHVIFNDANLIRAASHPGADTKQFKFGKTIDANISKLPEHLQEPVRNTTFSIERFGQSALNHLMFTRDLVERGVAMGMKSLHKYDVLREQRDARAGHFQKLGINAIEDVRLFTNPEKRALSKFLQTSTLSGDWGYGPQARGAAKAQFDALSPRAQQVAKNVFAHGAEMLKAKRASVEAAANETYGSMIKEARESGQAELVAQLESDRSLMLKKYDSLLKINEGTPYTSARRQGDFVVVGKSEAYQRAEAAARGPDATPAARKALYDMQDKAEHYMVSEAQSEQEAKVLRQNLRDAGFPATDDGAKYFPKEKWKAELEGGQGVLVGMSKLRNQIEGLRRGAQDPMEKDKYTTSLRLLTNMWLDALGSSSARKSEMRRLGVHGDMDMIRAFRLQSVADAHFISGIEYNDKMLTSLKDANKEAMTGASEDVTTKRALYDEFMARHHDTMNAPPTGIASKIARATALWQIATSPAHFLGNIMQPWTMTLPYLAAQHGHATATKEFFKAYKEIGDIFAKTGLLRSLKVDDMPADVRSAMSRLLELGRLDIGMNTEYGSMEFGEKSLVSRAAQAATDRITQASLKMESLNRLASAAAAYRLELRRTGDHEKSLHYAADMVADTHGDYSRSNAPRVFNNSFGKVALQFRKFQLVQMTYMGKLIGNLKNADPVERQVAMRALMFTLGHVGVLGGAMGMPGFGSLGAMQALRGWATGEPYQEDPETMLEKAIGNRDLAQLLLRGVPGLAGVDLTKKVGFGDMLAVAPAADINLADRQSVQEGLGQMATGPFGGLLLKAAGSLGQIQRGDWYKGLEGMMPQGIANIMKGLRMIGAAEGAGYLGTGGGLTNTKGDKLMDVTAGQALLAALGFTPSAMAMQSAETSSIMQSNADFKDRLEVLKTRYTNEVKQGVDVTGSVKALNDMRTTMMERGFKPVSLGDMLKAPTAQLIRQIFTTPGGVQYQPKTDGRAVAQLPQ